MLLAIKDSLRCVSDFWNGSDVGGTNATRVRLRGTISGKFKVPQGKQNLGCLRLYGA
jgi:hypothetical protein